MEYLNGKTWAEITREERVFCAELYKELKKNKEPFLTMCGLSIDKEYEIGFEVCFYRDIIKEYTEKYKEEFKMEVFEFSTKRTFDLVLFSDDEIHIFEAKCQQKFRNDQLKNIEEDTDKINRLYKVINAKKNLTLKIPEVKIWAIVSSEYKPKKEIEKHFKENIIYWNDIYKKYGNNKLFNRADTIFNK